MVKVGDRVVVKGWASLPTYVSRVYFEQPYGTELETKRLVMLELTWPDGATSKVKLYDEGVEWYQYSETN